MDTKSSTVAIVKSDSYDLGLKLLGAMDDLHSSEKNVVIKVGIYNPKRRMCTTVPVLSSIIQQFTNADKPKMRILEEFLVIQPMSDVD